jgi:hypothetical protein
MFTNETDDEIISECGFLAYIKSKDINNKSKSIMNKVDFVFYLTMLVTTWKAVSTQVQALVSGNLFSWLNIIFIVIAVLAYGLYEKFQGNTPVPTV